MKKGYLFHSVYLTGIAMVSSIAASENNNNTQTNTKEIQTQAVDPSKCGRNCDSCCWKGFEIGADFLWWKPFFDNTGYAKYTPSAQVTVNSSGINVAGTSQLKHVDTKWEPGFRVRIAKEDLWRGLDLLVNYVYIEGSSTAHTNLGEGENAELQSTTLPEVITLTDSAYKYSYLADKLKYRYQTFDVLFGTGYCFKKYYKLRPFVGVTGIFLKEKSSNFGVGSFAGIGETSGNWTFNTDFTGIGLKLGTDFGWRFWDGLSLDGMGAAVVAAGSYDAEYPVKTKVPANFTHPSFNAAIKNDFHLSVTGYQIALGFRYEKCISHCKLDLHLHYEMIGWNNLPNPGGLDIVDDTGVSTVYPTQIGAIVMTFQGITAGLDFHF